MRLLLRGLVDDEEARLVWPHPPFKEADGFQLGEVALHGPLADSPAARYPGNRRVGITLPPAGVVFPIEAVDDLVGQLRPIGEGPIAEQQDVRGLCVVMVQPVAVSQLVVA